MRCPRCRVGVMKVIDRARYIGRVWRRRRCRECKLKISTQEYCADQLDDAARAHLIHKTVLARKQTLTNPERARMAREGAPFEVKEEE